MTTRSEATQAARPLDRNVMRLAALFVQPSGCYADLPGIDAWPEQRDARRYAGPLPVVAHPPCQLWGAMANVNYARWGGEHNKPGNDGGCFAAALDSVRRFGGVLEHPAKTKAWAAHGLAQPAGIGWQRTVDGGWVCEVWQSAYGHRANKATWLYYHGTNPPFELRWDRPAGTHQIGFHDQRGKAANKPTLGKREANATPLEFRDELLRLAMMAHNAKSTPKQVHNIPMAPLLTIAQLAATLGVSPRTVSREISDGALQAVLIRGAVRIDPADAQAYISRQKTRRERSWPSTNAETAGITDFRSAGKKSRELLELLVAKRTR